MSKTSAKRVNSSSILANLEPKIVWTIFEEITHIPRPSKHEEHIRTWIKEWAQQHNIEWREDKVGNLLLRAAATKGYNTTPIITLQAHMDMVCQKTPETKIDFEHDPLVIAHNNEKVFAKGTTLGADNGVGIAMALATLIDSFPHGPLEVLLTVDEEAGMTGAMSIQADFFSGSRLINLDSEELGLITISSAGGFTAKINFAAKWQSSTNIKGSVAYKIKVGGLLGGHSGVDINLQRINAMKLLAEGLHKLAQQYSFMLGSFSGGTAHNAIPRDAECAIVLLNKDAPLLVTQVQSWISTVKTAIQSYEPNITLTIESTALPKALLSVGDTRRFFAVLGDIPFGVLSWSKEIPNLVQTSNNLAIVERINDNLVITSSSRSAKLEDLEQLRDSLTSLNTKYNVTVSPHSWYGSWAPEPNAPFLALVKQKYEKVLGKSVQLQAIHAGLECGQFKSLKPVLQIVSIGPEIKFPHSPQEHVIITSVNIVYMVLKEILSCTDNK